jgi:hypothetical protein
MLLDLAFVFISICHIVHDGRLPDYTTGVWVMGWT